MPSTPKRARSPWTSTGRPPAASADASTSLTAARTDQLGTGRRGVDEPFASSEKTPEQTRLETAAIPRRGSTSPSTASSWANRVSGTLALKLQSLAER